MAPILTLTGVSLAFGHRSVLNEVNLQISTGEKICLVGRNGAGKSTLLSVLSGAAAPDVGDIWRKETLRVSHLEQDVADESSATVYDAVASGLGDLGKLLSEFHHASESIEAKKESLSYIEQLQHRIEVLDGWNIEQTVLSTCSRLALPVERPLKLCSGGVKRRVMLAKALVSSPQLLLLDEPTNHMDIDAITWLEDFLKSFHGAVVFVSHDRTLARKLASKIIELDRGRLTQYNGDFMFYMRRREALLTEESRSNLKFDKELAAHEAWIRRGVKARRARNEGRVRKLLAMRSQKAQRPGMTGNVKLAANIDQDSGKRVIDLRHVTFCYDQTCIIRDFSTSVLRGDRVGIIGPNGCGKSTLLRIMLGELKPSQGGVVIGTQLHWAYFDQQRSQLDLNRTVRENINEGHDYVEINGKSRHVIGYLKDFLFPPNRLDSPAHILSGGERNRLLLAKTLAQPANFLVLDEPTNDLDIETLELLEDLLCDFPGTLLLVSHDRAFLDNVVSSVLVFEGGGNVTEYIGGYEDWLRQRPTSPPKRATSVRKESKGRRPASPDPAARKKLSYKEKRELEALPTEIEALEQEQCELQQRISQSSFYQQDKSTITSTIARIELIQQLLEQAYRRWQYLDSIEQL